MYIYFVQANFFGKRLIKIGKSKNPSKRILQQMQSSCPVDLKIIGAVKFDSCGEAEKYEHRLHNYLGKHIIKRGTYGNGPWTEWVEDTPEIRGHIREYIKTPGKLKEVLDSCHI